MQGKSRWRSERARSPANGIATFPMYKRTRTKSGGREPAVRLPIVWPARLRTYSETLVPRSATSGGRQSAVASGTAPATTIPHTFGHGRRTRTKSGGGNPPWLREPHLRRRYRHSSEDRRRCVGARSCHRVAATTVVTAGVERESNRLPNRRFTNHGGLTPPALVRARCSFPNGWAYRCQCVCRSHGG